MPLPNYFKDRYKDWKDKVFPSKKDSYRFLEKEGQNPKAMIISCCCLLYTSPSPRDRG